jgi:hypothetical protein
VDVILEVGHGEKRLYPLYEDIEKHFAALQDKLGKG